MESSGFFVGELWFAKKENIIGKYQEFNRGWADGVFYSCDFAGQSETYNTYTLSAFLANKEFKLTANPDALHVVLKKIGINDEVKNVYFNRITCNGKNTVDRKVLYPFVTFDSLNKALYLYEGAIFILVINNLIIGVFIYTFQHYLIIE